MVEGTAEQLDVEHGVRPLVRIFINMLFFSLLLTETFLKVEAQCNSHTFVVLHNMNPGCSQKMEYIQGYEMTTPVHQEKLSAMFHLSFVRICAKNDNKLAFKFSHFFLSKILDPTKTYINYPFQSFFARKMRTAAR